MTNLCHERCQPVLLQTDLFDALAQSEHGVCGVDAVLRVRHELQLAGTVLGVKLLQVHSSCQQHLLRVVQEAFELGEQLGRAHLRVDRTCNGQITIMDRSTSFYGSSSNNTNSSSHSRRLLRSSECNFTRRNEVSGYGRTEHPNNWPDSNFTYFIPVLNTQT